MTTVTAQQVADQLATVCREWLTPAELAEIESGDAALDDLCDGNMAMDLAFRRLGIDPLAGGEMSDEVTALWNAAYELFTESLDVATDDTRSNGNRG